MTLCVFGLHKVKQGYWDDYRTFKWLDKVKMLDVFVRDLQELVSGETKLKLYCNT